MSAPLCLATKMIKSQLKVQKPDVFPAFPRKTLLEFGNLMQPHPSLSQPQTAGSLSRTPLKAAGLDSSLWPCLTLGASSSNPRCYGS